MRIVHRPESVSCVVFLALGQFGSTGLNIVKSFIHVLGKLDLPQGKIKRRCYQPFDVEAAKDNASTAINFYATRARAVFGPGFDGSGFKRRLFTSAMRWLLRGRTMVAGHRQKGKTQSQCKFWKIHRHRITSLLGVNET